MLKFIVAPDTTAQIFWYFKTSYVEVYRRSIIQTRKPTAISKHLMLKFIRQIIYSHMSVFKISKHLMLKFIVFPSFPSFPGIPISKHLMLKFICRASDHVAQWTRISKHLMLKFISPPCSTSLSHLDFKTSYVEVYHKKKKTDLNGLSNFKTSYVEVYRKPLRR